MVSNGRPGEKLWSICDISFSDFQTRYIGVYAEIFLTKNTKKLKIAVLSSLKSFYVSITVYPVMVFDFGGKYCRLGR